MQNKKSELRKSRVFNLNSELKPLRNTEFGLLNKNSEFRTPHSAIGGFCMMKNLISGLKYSAFRNPNSAFQRGFTLIEIIVVIVILSIVAAISIDFLVSSLRVYAMTVNQKTLLDEGKLALERMCRDIRDAKSITGVTATSITFVRTNATFSDSGLPDDLVGETITFQLTGSTLEKVKSSPSVTVAIASNVSTFTVTRETTDEILIILTLSLGTGERVTLQTRVNPKNLTKIFSDGFESGNFSAWTSTSVTSCAMSVVNTRSHHGTYSQQVSSLQQVADRAWARKTITGGYTALYARAYYMFVGTLPTATGSWWNLTPIFDANSETIWANGHFPIFSFANSKWGIRYSIDDETFVNIWETGTSTTPTVNTWFCIELYCNITSHTLTLWIDGVQKVSSSGLTFRNDCLNAVDSGNAYLEVAEAAARTIAVDCVVVSDSYIGPHYKRFFQNWKEEESP